MAKIKAMNAVKKYIDDHGTTPFAVAQLVGFSPSTVCRHIKDERGISAESAVVYNRILGIALQDLRPDIFLPSPTQPDRQES